MPLELPAELLAQEVYDELDAGRVGLYELIWSLNGSNFTLTEQEKLATAVIVAREVMRSGRALLYEIRWPTDEVLAGPFDEDLLERADSFPAVPDERYLALMPL